MDKLPDYESENSSISLKINDSLNQTNIIPDVSDNTYEEKCKEKCKFIYNNKKYIIYIFLFILLIMGGFGLYGITIEPCTKNICKYNATPYCCDNPVMDLCKEYTEYNSFTKCNDINKKCNLFVCKLVHNNITTYVNYDETDKIYDSGEFLYVLCIISLLMSFTCPFCFILIIWKCKLEWLFCKDN